MKTVKSCILVGSAILFENINILLWKSAQSNANQNFICLLVQSCLAICTTLGQQMVYKKGVYKKLYSTCLMSRYWLKTTLNHSTHIGLNYTPHSNICVRCTLS